MSENNTGLETKKEVKKAVSIRKKITSTVLRVSIAGLLILGIATVINIESMKTSIVAESELLADTAATDSAVALESETRRNLNTITAYLSQVANEKLGAIKNCSTMMANMATDIFTNTENYAPMSITPPIAKNIGKLAVYYTTPNGVSYADRADEAALAANAGAFMKQILATNDVVLTCYISFNDGLHVLCDKDTALRLDDDFKGYDPTTRSWFTGAQERGTAGFTDIVDDERGRGLGVVCSAPFYDSTGSMRGAVGIGMLIQEINDLILNVDLGETGEAFVLNNKGEMIIGKAVQKDEEGNYIRVDIFSDDGMRNLITSGVSGVSRVTYNGREVYMAWNPIENAKWTLVTTLDVDEALEISTQTAQKISTLAETSTKDINSSILTSVLITIAVVLLMGLIVFIVGTKQSKRITDPIKSLTDGVGTLKDGNLDLKLEISTGDEIEHLADAFNVMTDRIKEYINNLTTITAEKERIGAELNVAKTIQASMLPFIFPPFPERDEFEIYATMTPAKEVGGDFYDFFLVDDDHLAVVIADVSGKGVPAALFMVIAKTLIKNHAQAGKSPAEVFTAANAQLCENNEAEMFVTAWMGILEISSGKFTFVNAGHNPPLVMRKDGEFEYLRSRAGFVLAGMEGMRYRQNEMQLNVGDELYLYTDGVTEATSAENELYGEERLKNMLNLNTQTSPEALLPIVKDDIDAFVKEAPQFDDITMLALKIKASDDNSDVLDIEAALENADKVNDFIGEVLEKHGFDTKNIMRVQIAAEEVFVNIAHYAYAPNEGDAKITCFYDEKNEKIEITFADGGKQYNPLEKEDPDVTLSADEREIGGLGIYMVKKSMDEVYYKYDNGKNMLTIVKQK